jgi:hypothetical protein
MHLDYDTEVPSKVTRWQLAFLRSTVSTLVMAVIDVTSELALHMRILDERDFG